MRERGQWPCTRHKGGGGAGHSQEDMGGAPLQGGVDGCL